MNSSEITQFISELEQLYVPDNRTEVFDLTVRNEGDRFVIEGETSSHSAYDALIGRLSEKTTIRVRLLPDEVVGAQQWGIIYNTVQKMHQTHSFRSETVTELLMGMPVKLLDQKEEWRRVVTPEGYIGWVPDGLTAFTEENFNAYNQLKKVMITAAYTFVYLADNKRDGVVSNLVMGNLLAVKGETNNYYQVLYPDGREGYVCKDDAMFATEWWGDVELSQERIVQQAQQLLGLPYVWGGTSMHGLDCSGLTKLVYYMNGIVLPRDVSQQVRCGVLVDDKREYDQLQLGDLIFFGTPASEGSGEKVVHVAISLGGERFIHASDYVRLNSFDPQDPLYDAFNTSRYLRTKRIIGIAGDGCYRELVDTPFYHSFFK